MYVDVHEEIRGQLTEVSSLFYYVGSKNGAQIVSLESKHFYTISHSVAHRPYLGAHLKN